MNKNELIQKLDGHLSRPQKSERWAMYRLIVPVIDYANSTLGMRDYFEFNQTSAHGTSQSVDLTLLDDHGPRVMVEAKRVDRRIAAEQISKYLTSGVRGIVTNGVHWVLCLDGKSKAVSLSHLTNGAVAADAFDEVVAFIRGEVLPEPGWSTDQKYIEPTVKPAKFRKAVKARRISHPVHSAANTSVMRSEIASLSRLSDLERLFLETLLCEFERQEGLPGHLRCEIRSSRVVFFDDRVVTRSKRVARIELGKKQPDILVLTTLADSDPALKNIARAAPHDKGAHMRRFRLNEDAQTMRFGESLTKLLSA